MESVSEIDRRGFQVEVWDWTTKDFDLIASTGAAFSSMTGYFAGALITDEGADELLRTAEQSRVRVRKSQHSSRPRRHSICQVCRRPESGDGGEQSTPEAQP